MQGRITKLKGCPECGATCDGHACRCGWTKKRHGERAAAVYPTCKLCNMPGTHGGFCQMHLEQQAEYFHKKRMAEYDKALEPEDKNDVLQRNSVQENGERFCKQQEEANDG